jgi:hypothetical protein
MARSCYDEPTSSETGLATGMADEQRTADRDGHSAEPSGVILASAANHERAYYFYYYVGFTPTFVLPRARRWRRMT